MTRNEAYYGAESPNMGLKCTRAMTLASPQMDAHNFLEDRDAAYLILIDRLTYICAVVNISLL